MEDYTAIIVAMSVAFTGIVLGILKTVLPYIAKKRNGTPSSPQPPAEARPSLDSMSDTGRHYAIDFVTKEDFRELTSKLDLQFTTIGNQIGELTRAVGQLEGKTGK